MKGDKKPRAKPTVYSKALAEKICSRLAAGETLRSVCRDNGMPSETAVRKWSRANKNGFHSQYARARDIGLDAIADETIEIADDGTNDWMERNNPDNPGWVENGESINRSRLRADVRKWYLSKMAPKKYGERLDLNPDPEVPMNTNDTASADALVKLLIDKGASEHEIRAVLNAAKQQ